MDERNYTVSFLLPKINAAIDKIKKITNNIFAMSMAEPAILVNPSTAAMMAIIKNVTAYCNIRTSFFFFNICILVF